MSDNQFEYLYPIESWSDAQVAEYIEHHQLPVSPIYAAGAPHGSDCLHCTAWWDDGRLPYLREHYRWRFSGSSAMLRACMTRSPSNSNHDRGANS